MSCKLMQDGSEVVQCYMGQMGQFYVVPRSHVTA